VSWPFGPLPPLFVLRGGSLPSLCFVGHQSNLPSVSTPRLHPCDFRLCLPSLPFLTISLLPLLEPFLGGPGDPESSPSLCVFSFPKAFVWWSNHYTPGQSCFVFISPPLCAILVLPRPSLFHVFPFIFLDTPTVRTLLLRVHPLTTSASFLLRLPFSFVLF